MNILKLTSLSLLLLTGPVLLAEPPAVSPPNATDPLAEALPILQTKYADFKALQFKEGDHLSDLIARSGGKISLSAPETATSAIPSPSVPVALPDNILYWRLATFTPEKSWLDTGRQLQQVAPSTVGVILDLRSTIAPDDYRGASWVLSLFTSGDPTLIKYQEDSSGCIGLGIESRYRFHCPIVVLTNNKTTGAAEALAACLQADGALVVGRATAGKMGVFDEQKLSSGQILRYFVSPVGSEEDPQAVFKIPQHPLPWDQPVTPDISLTVDDRAEKGALTLIKDNHILDVIQESAQRHRMNEASLVRGQDPEWDDYLASLERKPVLLSLPIIHDVVLIRALDSLKAIRLSQSPLPAQARADATPQASASLQ
jgi:hypothetical protein